jgi:endonuclease/exonuclease/phosphatase family metal-dependent hydrolase
MLVRLAWLRRRKVGLGLTLGLGLGALLATARCEPEPLRVVTYNIENFPKSELQIEHAFRTIAGLDAPIVAVQEILDREAFERAARTELGSNWKVATSSSSRAVGLIYDSDRVKLRGRAEHEIGGRKVLEARLEPRRGPAIRVFVVHLKAGGPESVEIRRAQIEAMTPIVARAVAESRDEIVVLGDFNATQEDDRRNLRRFAERTGLTWASEPLECTAYWSRRRDNGQTLGDCPGSALDHVFTRSTPKTIAAKGLCEDLGCDGGLLCPVSRFLVSDHCPVLTEL